MERVALGLLGDVFKPLAEAFSNTVQGRFMEPTRDAGAARVYNSSERNIFGTAAWRSIRRDLRRPRKIPNLVRFRPGRRTSSGACSASSVGLRLRTVFIWT